MGEGGGVLGSSPRKFQVYMVLRRVVQDKINIEMPLHKTQGLEVKFLNFCEDFEKGNVEKG